MFKLSGQLSTVTRNQKYFRTRENRNFSTVRSTEKRIVNFSLIQSGLVIAMGALQVFIVRFFFQVRYFHVLVDRGTLLTRNIGCSQGLRLSRKPNALRWSWLFGEALGKNHERVAAYCIL